MKNYIGIDLGATKTKIDIFDERYKVLAEKILLTTSKSGYDSVIKSIADNINSMLLAIGISIDSISCIGVGVAASIDYKSNKLIYANNLDWKEVQLEQEIRKYFDKDIYLVNDACAAALAEHKFGSSADYKNSVLITLGTGIGAGIILNNKLFLGGDKYGIELGHIIIDVNGKKCNCGKRGCFETVASVNSLIGEIRDSVEVKNSLIMCLCDNDLINLKGEMVFEAASMGDNFAKKILNKYIDYLAIGISNIVLMYRPQIVVIGGGIIQVGDLLIKPLNNKLEELSSDMEFLPIPKIVKVKLGNKAGTLGAVLAAQML